MGGGGVETSGVARQLHQPPSATTQSSNNCSHFNRDAGGSAPSHPSARAGEQLLLAPQTHSGARSCPVWQVSFSADIGSK